MEIKNMFGDVLFELESAKTIAEVVTAAVKAGKSLRDADLRDAVLRGADLSGAVLSDAGFDGVPVIPNIHQTVLDAASKPEALNMGSWHSGYVCGTTHCRAGWVVTLAGAGGRALEWAMGTPAAAAIIYMASDPKLEKIPDFYATNERALADMKRLADAEKESATHA